MKTNYGLDVVSRRSALKFIGSGLALTGVAAAPVSARSDTLAHELNAVRAATRKYRDVDLADEDGYVLGSPYVPGMGFHFVRADLVAPSEHVGPVDGLENPPILVYYTTGNYSPQPFSPHDPTRDGDLRLGAVEYAHAGCPGAAADYFSDEDASRHLKTTEEEGWEPIPDSPLTALHVWVHRNNPAGVFHPTNPTID